MVDFGDKGAERQPKLRVLKGGAEPRSTKVDEQDIAGAVEKISTEDRSLGISKNDDLLTTAKNAAIDIYKTNARNPMAELWRRIGNQEIDERVIEPIYRLIIKRNPELEAFVTKSADKVNKRVESGPENPPLRLLSNAIKSVRDRFKRAI